MTETVQEESLTTISEHDGQGVYQPPPEMVEQANITAYMRQKGFKTFEQLYQRTGCWRSRPPGRR